MMIGALPAVMIRLLVAWTGAWIVDVDVDLPDSLEVPSGRQIVTIGGTQLSGTVDARGSGRFGAKARVRVVAGAGAWDSVVGKLDMHNDAPSGITSSLVLAQVAASVGEVVEDPNPISYGTYYQRIEGRAVEHLAGRQWYVDALGVTHVADWPTIPVGQDVDVIAWHPESRRAEVSADEIIWPGTAITDSRFGTIIVRDVEQTWTSEHGSKGQVWTSDTPASRWGSALEALSTSFDDEKLLRVYRYAVTSVGVDLRLNLQARQKGVPDTISFPVWPGIPGATFKPALGSEVLVVFENGSPNLPRVVGFSGVSPTEFYLDATTLIRLGENATSYVALATIVDSINNAAKTFAIAISTYASAIQGIADPTNVATPVLLAASTAFQNAVVSAAAAKVKAE